MATSLFSRNMQAQGWRYDPAARGVGGYIRPDTTWDARTQSFTTNSNVGGTVFMPRTTGASSGISSLMRSPTLPAASAPQSIGFSPVAVGGTVRANPVTAAMASWAAPDVETAMRDVGSVRARDVDPFMVEDTKILQELDRQAQEELSLGGFLSPSEEREAQQAARTAFASRGLATGDPAALAEVLNRDRFARERQAERRGFAADVSGMMSNLDLANQGEYNRVELANADAGLRASMANQGARLQTWDTGQKGTLQVALSNQDATNRIALENEANRIEAAKFNVDAGLRASIANQGAGLQAGQINAGNALDFARLNQEGVLGSFNASTNRLNALTNMSSASTSGGGGPSYMSLYDDARRRQADRQRAAGMAAGSGVGSVYRPLGTMSVVRPGYRGL